MKIEQLSYCTMRGGVSHAHLYILYNGLEASST